MKIVEYTLSVKFAARIVSLYVKMLHSWFTWKTFDMLLTPLKDLVFFITCIRYAEVKFSPAGDWVSPLLPPSSKIFSGVYNL